jgi:hypothetical protein
MEEYKTLCEGRAEQIKHLTSSPEEKVIEEMNKKYAIIHTQSTFVLVEKEEDVFVLDSRQSLINYHENDFFEDSERNMQNKAKFWLKHPNRRTYKNLVFDPAHPGNFNNNYNIFKGFSVTPKQGDSSLYWKHVQEVICNGNQEHYQYVKKWMASVIQKPDLLATAIVLRGLQGTGKNKFGETFGKLFGSHFLVLSNLDHIIGHFNSHLQNAYLLLANEAIWGGNKKEVGALKALITDPTIFIEAKGKDGFQVKNCRHLIVCSNEGWAVPMDLDDRRFFCLDVSPNHKEDIPYFRALEKQMSEGGLEALMYDLINENLEGFDPRIMPANDSGFDMKMKSASSTDKYIYHALQAGSWNLVANVPIGTFGDISCQILHKCYQEWSEEEGLKKEGSSEFGKSLKKLIPSVTKERPTIDGNRFWSYQFPSLEQCRLEFQQFTKQTDSIWKDVHDIQR